MILAERAEQESQEGAPPRPSNGIDKASWLAGRLAGWLAGLG